MSVREEIVREPLVSVVLPVFNSQEFLEETLECVCNQSYKHLEIIVIDDKSTDQSLSILKKFAQKDWRIKIIEHEVNQGVGAARNQAIQLATGEYICFVDSDDVVFDSYVSSMLEVMLRRDVDLVFAPISQYSEVSGAFYQDGYYANLALARFAGRDAFSGAELIPMMGEVNVSPCAKLFKTQLVRDLDVKFPVDVRFEDNVFFWDFVLAPEVKISLTDQPGYLYRSMRQGSASSTSANFVDVFRVNDMVGDILEKRGIFTTKDGYRSFLVYKWTAFWVWSRGRLNGVPGKAYIKGARENFKNVQAAKEFSDSRMVAFEFGLLKKSSLLAQLFFSVWTDGRFQADFRELMGARIIRLPIDAARFVVAIASNLVRIGVIGVPLWWRVYRLKGKA